MPPRRRPPRCPAPSCGKAGDARASPAVWLVSCHWLLADCPYRYCRTPRHVISIRLPSSPRSGAAPPKEPAVRCPSDAASPHPPVGWELDARRLLYAKRLLSLPAGHSHPSMPFILMPFLAPSEAVHAPSGAVCGSWGHYWLTLRIPDVYFTDLCVQPPPCEFHVPR